LDKGYSSWVDVCELQLLRPALFRIYSREREFCDLGINDVPWESREQEKYLKKSLPAILFVSATLLGFASLLAHPFGAVKIPASNKPLLEGASVDPAVMQIMERSCQNCHSEKTDWPWYSYVAPMSWLIEKDVSEARTHMNLSRWDEYNSESQQQILAEITSVVGNRRMPLPRYLKLHPEAALSEAEIDQLYQWARAERARLKSIGGSR